MQLPYPAPGSGDAPPARAGTALEALDLLSETVKGLRDEIVQDAERRRKEAEAEAWRLRRRSTFIVVWLVAAVLLLGGLFTVALQNRKINSQNGSIARRIADCTTSGGQCYEDGQRRTGTAIQEIILGNIYIQQCAKVTQTDAELEQCVIRRMTSQPPQPPSASPSPSPGG